jgi:hypothetical protein
MLLFSRFHVTMTVEPRGMNMDLRRFVVPFTSRREHWNKFARKVQAFGDLIREKTLED